MFKVSDKIKGTVIAEDFPVEVDGAVAEHNSLLQLNLNCHSDELL